MPIKHVTQANLTDRGLACVAMVAGKSLDTVLRIAVKECGYPKDGPHTTTDENLFKLLDHFGIKYGKKQKVKTVEALPPLAIMETRKMPSTGNSHLVVFERTADGDEHALDPGWWLKQQVRSDWNRIKLDTFIPILAGNDSTGKKGGKAAKAPATAVPSGEAEAVAAEKPAKVTKLKNPAPKVAKANSSAKRKTPPATKATEEPAARTTAPSLTDEWAETGMPTGTTDTATSEGGTDVA